MIPHATSPLVDAGDDDKNDEETDITGGARILGTAIEIGAYEFHSPCAAFADLSDVIVYVNHAATGLADGTSWANAFTELQPALDLAVCSEVTEIRVASGTYLPTEAPDDSTVNDRDKAFNLDTDVVLKGSYNPETDMQDYTDPSILSGDISSTPDNDADNAYHVFVTVGLTATTIIDGFSISGGNANGGGSSITYSSQTFYRLFGGGLYNISSSPTITNSTFSGNSATKGGGMYNDDFSFPTLHNTVLYDNTADAEDNLHGTINGESSSHNASDDTAGGINLLPGFVDLKDTDPFIDSTDPDGADDIFGTADDGLIPHGTSPLIDAGDNDKNDEETDITGGARVMDTTIDIGAYEGQSSLSSDRPVVETTILYPNPTSSEVYLNYATATNTTYGLFDMAGKRLATYTQSGTVHQLDVSSHAKGTYILKATSGLQVNYYRIVKE